MAFFHRWGVFPVIFELDLTGMDVHCTEQLLRAEWEFFRLCFKNKPAVMSWIAQIEDWFIHNRGTYKDMFSFMLNGCRMSGDMHTGFGNCMAMLAMFWAFVARHKINRSDVLNDGDDMNIYVHPDDVHIIKAHLVDFFLDCGHELKLIERDHWMNVEWCQAKLVRVNVPPEVAATRVFDSDFCAGTTIPVFVRNPCKIFTTLGSDVHMSDRADTAADFVMANLHALGKSFVDVPGFSNLPNIAKRGLLDGKLLGSGTKYRLLESYSDSQQTQCEHTCSDMVRAWGIPLPVLQSMDCEAAALQRDSIVAACADALALSTKHTLG